MKKSYKLKVGNPKFMDTDARKEALSIAKGAIKAEADEVVHHSKFNRQNGSDIVSLESDATIPSTLAYRTAKTPKATAFYYPDSSGKMKQLTWSQVSSQVKDISGGLRSLNVSPKETVAIMSSTNIDWVLSDLAINSLGATTCAIMPGTSGEQLVHILNDSEAKTIIVENDEQLNKLDALKDKLPKLEKIVTLHGGSISKNNNVVDCNSPKLLTDFKTLKLSGKNWNDMNPGEYEKGLKNVKSDDIATLLYTSGTTGMPKGVELPHSVWASQQEAAVKTGLVDSNDKQYLWLPLAHSFGKFLLSVSVRMGIPTVVDGNPKNIARGLELTKPTFTSGVPRIFEKIYNGVMNKKKTPLQRMIFNWAMDVGYQVSKKHEEGKRLGMSLSLKYALADSLVFSKIRKKFGGRLKFMISGGAPLSAEIARGLDVMGLKTYEGYGLTETGGASHINLPKTNEYGTVGKALPGVDVKLSDELGSKGEILIKGRNIMRSYHNLPEKTKSEFTKDGYFRTGDIGEFTEKGNLKITDRIKNIFKLSTGEYVAPSPMEQEIKSCGKGLINNVLVHGYNKKYCTAIITLDENALKTSGIWDGKMPFNEDAKVKKTVQNIVDDMNDKLNLKGSNAVCKFFIAPKDFEVGCELTETQKVVRKVVEAKYAKQLEDLYIEKTPNLYKLQTEKKMQKNDLQPSL